MRRLAILATSLILIAISDSATAGPLPLAPLARNVEPAVVLGAGQAEAGRHPDPEGQAGLAKPDGLQVRRHVSSASHPDRHQSHDLHRNRQEPRRGACKMPVAASALRRRRREIARPCRMDKCAASAGNRACMCMCCAQMRAGTPRVTIG